MVAVSVNISLRIPVYVLNALYLWLITIWTYLKYGRPPPMKRGESMPSHCAHHPPHRSGGGETDNAHSTQGGSMDDNTSDSEAKADGGESDLGNNHVSEKRR